MFLRRRRREEGKGIIISGLFSTLKSSIHINIYFQTLILYVLDQQVLHHGTDGLVGDGCPSVPDPIGALHPEDVPESARLHLLWTPPVEIVPGDALQDLQVLGSQASFVMVPRV